MLFVVGLAMSENPTPYTVRDKMLQNALEESFAIHLRVLFDFLFAPARTCDDISAEDYVLDVSQWCANRGKPSLALQTAKARANKEIAHLTTRRVQGEPPAKAWPVEPILKEMYGFLGRFVESASPARLHPRVAGFLKQYADPEFRSTALLKIAKAPTDGD